MDEQTRDRVLRCARDAGIGADQLGELAESWSNHAVMVNGPTPAVLRVCYAGAVDRLLVEAALAAELPAEVGHPELLGHGRTGELTWTLTRRLTGMPLEQAWPQVSSSARRAATEATAVALDALYRHRPSAGVVEAMLALQAGLDHSRDDGAVSVSMFAFPLERASRLLASNQTSFPPELATGVQEFLDDHAALAPRVDQPGLGVIHGDPHAANVWFDGERVTGLIDLEWARLADPVLDLGRVTERELADRAEGRELHQEFVAALVELLPAWQVTADQRRVATLGCLVRESLLWQPLTQQSPPDHPAHLAASLLGGGSR